MNNEQKQTLIRHLQQFRRGWWFEDGVIRFTSSNQPVEAARAELERCIKHAEEAKLFLAEVDKEM